MSVNCTTCGDNVYPAVPMPKESEESKLERHKELENADRGDMRISAFQSNASAVRAIASAVEGTLGPKGLDTMLVNGRGEVVVTNDGVTILERMDVKHPAAHMLVNISRAQQEEVGDGTTTATCWLLRLLMRE